MSMALSVAGCASSQSDIWEPDEILGVAGIAAVVHGRPCDLSRAVEEAAAEIGMQVVERTPQVTFSGTDYSLEGADGSNGLLRVWYGKRKTLKKGMSMRVNYTADWAVSTLELPIQVCFGADGDGPREGAFVRSLQAKLRELGEKDARALYGSVLTP